MCIQYAMLPCSQIPFVSLFLFSLVEFTIAHYVPLKDELQLRTLVSNATSLNSTTKQSSTVQGWTPSPNSRGTMDIIWGCLSTIALCTWSLVRVNVPAPNETSLKNFRRKVSLTALGVFAPDIILALALGQWVSARRSVRAFHSDAIPQWILRYAFFADMGGFVLKSPDLPPFPLNAAQVHYLVVNNFVDLPAQLSDIKNKSRDQVGLAVLILQLGWFILNMLGRLVQKLPITPLELATVGYVACAMGVLSFWRHKPTEVDSTIVLKSNCSLAEIIVKAGPAADIPYILTPLDFVDRATLSWDSNWSYIEGILHGGGIAFIRTRRPIERIPDIGFRFSSRTWPLLFSIQLIYAGSLLAGWSLHFPSHPERMLWHIATVMILTSICIFWIVDRTTHQLIPFVKRFLRDFTGNAASYSSHRDPKATLQQYTPVKTPAPVLIFLLVYATGRLVVLVEVLINLRSVPSPVYQNVNWSKYLPHF
jgi:predicted membrane channel-forming protein YqfA (hemolysin III family)